MHPEERVEHQSFCFTWKDILIIYNIIKENELAIVGEPSGIKSKIFKKLAFHEATLKKKIERDESEGIKTYLFMSKLVMDNKLKERINAKKEQKFSFQESQELSDANKEKFVLKRVKYSINTIIKHLNFLSRTNFNVDGNENTENIAIELNKMITMEGFSEMLKEKTLPLEWFGLYLQSNIENIPVDYKKDNYSLLYSELIKESCDNLEKIKVDDSLNIIYNKIINSEKNIDISSNGLKRIKNNEQKFEIFFFILKTKIPVIMNIYYTGEDVINKIELKKKDEHTSKKNTREENKKTFECDYILDFCCFFPALTNDIENYYVYEEKLKIKSFLDDYFNIIKEYIMEDEIFNEYKDEEKKNIQIQIKNFIHAQIYNKIFITQQNEIDKKISDKCKKFNWIKPQNINKDLKHVDDKMVQIMLYFANNMIYEMSPLNKINQFEKIDMIINNLLILYGFDAKFYNNLMIYVFIKAEPENLNSIFQYINIYLDKELSNKYCSLLNKIEQLIQNLSYFTEKNLEDGIKKDEK
jgi:hypothetical protein